MTGLPLPRTGPPSVSSCAPTPDGYAASTDFLALAGMTYRKLDYWSRIGVLRPANPGHGSGSKRLFLRDEVAVAAAILRLCSLGFSLHVATSVARGPRPAEGTIEVIAQPVLGVRLVVTADLWQVPQ